MQIVITGANRGIGLEFVRQLQGQGHTLIATARRPEHAKDLQALAQEALGSTHVLSLDQTDPESVKSFASAVQDIGPTDVLINNAGMYPRSGTLGDLDYNAMAHGFQTNALGPLRVTEALLPSLRQGSAKKIAFVTSRMGSLADNTSGSSYGYRASKTALNMFVKSLALDLQDERISAFLLHPGWVKTDMGGPNALITTETSVAGLLNVIQNATLDTTGTFLNWDGASIPW